MTTTEQTLLAQVPLVTDGVPLGMPGEFPGFRFYVQAAVTPSGSTLPFTLGVSTLGGPQWYDLSDSIQGVDWDRGGQPGSRPIAGQAAIRLLNNEGQWSPWVNPYYGPGTLIRILVSDGVTMYYQFTGLTQAWQEDGAGMDAYAWVDIVVWEVQFLLNEVNNNALVSSVGAGENLATRFARLMTYITWAFNTSVVAPAASVATFQGTDLGQDIATETYLTVDSVEAVVWSGKDGTLNIRDRATGTGVLWTVEANDYDPDALKTANDDVRIVAQVSLARIGGTEVVYPNAGVAGRYKTRTTKRDGVNTVAEAADADLQRIATGILGRSTGNPYRPVSLSMVSEQNANVRNILVKGDLEDRLTIKHVVQTNKRLVFYSYAVCAIKMGVTYKDGGTFWTGTFSLDIEVDSHWGVYLPVWIWGVSFWGSTTEGWGPA